MSVVVSRLVKPLCLGLIVAVANVGLVFAQIDMEPKIPEELKEFDFLLGEWKTEVEFFNREGEVVQVMNFAAIIEPVVGGVFYRGWSGPLDMSQQFGETWYLYEKANEKFRIVAADNQGNFDVFNGVVLEDRKVFTNSPKPWRDGRIIIWRRTYYNIEEDSHEVIMEYSFDNGYTWTKANHWIRAKRQ